MRSGRDKETEPIIKFDIWIACFRHRRYVGERLQSCPVRNRERAQLAALCLRHNWRRRGKANRSMARNGRADCQASAAVGYVRKVEAERLAHEFTHHVAGRDRSLGMLRPSRLRSARYGPFKHAEGKVRLVELISIKLEKLLNVATVDFELLDNRASAFLSVSIAASVEMTHSRRVLI